MKIKDVSIPSSELVALKVFRSQIGVSDVTTWRWVKRGWLRVVNISGKPYVTRDSILEFVRRACAGEFSQKPAGAARTAAEKRATSTAGMEGS